MIQALVVHMSIIGIVLLLLFGKQSNRAYLLHVLSSAVFMYLVYVYIPWTTYGSAYLKYVYLVFYLLALGLSLRYTKRVVRNMAPGWVKMGGYFFKAMLLGLLIIPLLYIDLSTRLEKPSKEIDLHFPFKNGNYAIVGGGNNVLLNYHIELEQAYYHRAFDFVKLGKFGNTGLSLLQPDALNADSYIFGDSIFSPCSGIITTVVNDQPDHEPGKLEDFADDRANVVAIKNQDNYIILAHFKQHTIVVDTLDLVEMGDFIGLVGNSGESSSPHLHIHVRDETNRPVEILFNGNKYIKNDIIRIK
ncbi:peptidoglycan DD-metalloendopeptidase family protein [Sunxiuqinia rutila]|uniref:M23 family metallopeptidase n=1 Tax=Sunxiuqinia rutila TaxID=1397841 RepID=UPI003D36F5EC